MSATTCTTASTATRRGRLWPSTSTGSSTPDDPVRAAAHGYRKHLYVGPGPDGVHVTGTVWLHRRHGVWLRRLAARGAELLWCTSWRHLAPQWIAPRLALPSTWPVIDIAGSGVRWGARSSSPVCTP
ncbi:MAG TPA: hypothetical protein VFC00_26015, partial [Micromonosporaceae bacterium]|nr:hypothetical protein [Micromonosporaceae bacterium]